MPWLTSFSRACSQTCSSTVQQPHRTALTPYDRHRPLACVNDLYRPLCPRWQGQGLRRRSKSRGRSDGVACLRMTSRNPQAGYRSATGFANPLRDGGDRPGRGRQSSVWFLVRQTRRNVGDGADTRLAHNPGSPAGTALAVLLQHHPVPGAGTARRASTWSASAPMAARTGWAWPTAQENPRHAGLEL
jgi:hypothetical protein